MTAIGSKGDCNDAFFHVLSKSEDACADLGYDFESLRNDLEEIKLDEVIGEFAKNVFLRIFIKEHRGNKILSEMLFRSVESSDTLPLFNMLLEEGVSPEKAELEFETKADLDSLSWAGLLTANPENYANLEFFKNTLNLHPLDAQALTYILWLMCQNPKEGQEEREIEVMEFLLSKGATCDAAAIAKYPPFILAADGDFMPSFDKLRENKPKVKKFLEAQMKLQAEHPFTSEEKKM